MGAGDALAERMTRAVAALRTVAATGPGVYGAPDPESGEQWDAGNVLGHLAEMLPFWTEQTRSVLGGAGEMGRGTEGYESRRRGVDSGRSLPENMLRSRIEAGATELVELLRGLQPGDLERRLVYHARSGDRSLSLREALDELLVGHLEGHVQQLRELGRPGAGG